MTGGIRVANDRIDFTGGTLHGTTVAQTGIQRDDRGGTIYTARLEVQSEGRPMVTGTLRFGLSAYKELSGSEEAKRAAVREKLVAKLAEDWRDGFSFTLGRVNGDPTIQ